MIRAGTTGIKRMVFREQPFKQGLAGHIPVELHREIP